MKKSLYDGSTNLNPEGIRLLDLFKEDYTTHDKKLCYGFWALAVHRFGNWRMDIKTKLLRAPFSFVYKFLFVMVEIICGIKLSYNVKVGRRVKIEHFGGMILGAREIGNDVTIRQNTTFGVKSKYHLDAKPTIESGVDIGCGVVILGNVRVGKGSIIGANSVVISDVPDYTVVAGIPAKILKTLPNENN